MDLFVDKNQAGSRSDSKAESDRKWIQIHIIIWLGIDCSFISHAGPGSIGIGLMEANTVCRASGLVQRSHLQGWCSAATFRAGAVVKSRKVT